MSGLFRKEYHGISRKSQYGVFFDAFVSQRHVVALLWFRAMSQQHQVR